MKKALKKIEDAPVLGVTKTGKYIYVEPSLNEDFTAKDHLDAYNAHANFLMHNSLMGGTKEKHQNAMNEHYLRAVRTE